MLVTSKRPKCFQISLAVIGVILFIAAYSSCSTNNTCGRYMGSAAHHSSHHSSHHGGACIRSDAFIMDNEINFITLNDIKVGTFIFTATDSINKFSVFHQVVNKTCHYGKYRLWKMPNIPEITTPNHPIMINNIWYSGDPIESKKYFNIDTVKLGQLGNNIVNKVCSIELDTKTSIPFYVFYENIWIKAAE